MSLDFTRDFSELKVCVIIPTYNNSKTLRHVISDALNYCSDVMVVNDGSTDETEQLINEFQQVHSLTYHPNRGKGWALRKGFEFARSKGFEYAITIDSDGQHSAADIPAFLEKLKEERNAIIIGARNMDQESVPGGSSFGNRFSTFWFKLETGISVPDTQSGFRLYPLVPLSLMSFFTRKYEFEIEVLVRSAWNGIRITSVPVSVYYPPASERVSHFRPFWDFVRISLLNTVLVLITFLYIKPRNLIRSLGTGNFWKKLNDMIWVPGEPDSKKAVSLGLGIFMGIFPIWGFQLITAIFLSIFFKLNKALVIIAANISLPPVIPFILYGSYRMGAIWMGDRAMQLDLTKKLTLESVKNNLEQYIYGAVTLSVLAGLITGIISYSLLKIFKQRKAVTG